MAIKEFELVSWIKYFAIDLIKVLNANENNIAKNVLCVRNMT